MRHLVQILVLFGGLLLFADAAEAQRHKRTRILFVFDASYSMFGNLDEQKKIAVAKNLLGNLIDSLAEKPNVKLGFRAYGHQTPRRKYDCQDTKLEVGFYPDNKQDILDELKKIEPKGTTPIAYSLQQAGSDFPDAPRARNVIILLTDGIEECQGDPCKVSRSLQRNNVVLKPFVIGIGIEKKYKNQLDCLGRYFNAANKKEFREALSVVVSQAVNATSAQVKLLDVNGKATETDVNMTFYDKEQDLILHNLYHTMDATGKPDTLYLDPSPNYNLQVHTTPPVWKRDISLEAGEHNNILLKAPQGRIAFNVNGSKIYSRLPMVVRQSGKNCRIINKQMEGTSHRYLVGRYDVSILTTPRIHLNNVKVEQDKVNKINIPAPGKVYVSKSTNMHGSIYQKVSGKMKWVCNIEERLRRERIILQPGAYRIVTRPSNAINTNKTNVKEFKIKSGSSLKIKVN
jgi:Ca-activated chloride channel family protein